MENYNESLNIEDYKNYISNNFNDNEEVILIFYFYLFILYFI